MFILRKKRVYLSLAGSLLFILLLLFVTIQLFSVPPKSTLEIKEYNLPTSSDYDPIYSPTGEFAAFALTERSKNNMEGRFQIYVINLEDFKIRKIDEFNQELSPSSISNPHLAWKDNMIGIFYVEFGSTPVFCKKHSILPQKVQKIEEHYGSTESKRCMEEVSSYPTISFSCRADQPANSCYTMQASSRDGKFYFRSTTHDYPFIYSIGHCSIVWGSICSYQLIEVFRNSDRKKIGRIVFEREKRRQVVWGPQTRLFFQSKEKGKLFYVDTSRF